MIYIGIILFSLIVELVFSPRFDRTSEGKVLLWYGVKKRKYFIIFQSPIRKIEDFCNYLILRYMNKELCFIFKNGFEIKGVDKKYWDLYKCEVVEVRKRV